MHRPLSLLAFALLLTVPARAPATDTTSIHVLRAIAADASIRIRNAAGSVRVSGWDRNAVQVTGSLGSGNKPLIVEGGGRNLVIRVESSTPSGWFHWWGHSSAASAQLDVRVPRAVALALNVVSAKADVDGLAGGRLDIQSVSGPVRVRADCPRVAVTTVSGDVDLAGAMPSLHVETVSGDVSLPAAGADLHLQTVSGNLRVGGGPLRDADIGSVSGDVQITTAVAPDVLLHVKTLSGDVQLTLPATLSAQLDAETFSGALEGVLTAASKEKQDSGRRVTLRYGASQGRIRLETFSGDIRVLMLDPES